MISGQITVTLIPHGISVLNFGEEINISCNASKNTEMQSVRYSWILNNDSINETSSLLTVTYNSTESVEQGGIYRCLVHTSDMVLVGRSNIIMIAFAPLIFEQPQAKSSLFGDDAFFNCSSTGFPLPFIEWHVVSTNVSISNIEEVEAHSLNLVHNHTVYDKELTTSSTLVIKDVLFSDYGNYVCVAVLSNESLVVTENCCNGNESVSSQNVPQYTISDTVTLTGN